MDRYEWIGWLSSLVLLWTIGVQVRKQIREGTSEGVSRWLYIGQLGSEIGFIVYAWMLGNWVFVSTNAAMLVANGIGLVILLRHRSRAADSASAGIERKNGSRVGGDPSVAS